MNFKSAAQKFILLIVPAIVLLVVDLVFFMNGQMTWSESIWGVNEKTIAVAFGIGMICGHCFTVPYKERPYNIYTSFLLWTLVILNFVVPFLLFMV